MKIQNQKVHSLRPDKNTQVDPYKKIAKSMEQNFLNFLIEKMRKSAPAEEDSSAAMNYYKGLLDSERAKIMAETHGGVGLQDIILKQISPSYKYDSYQRVSKGLSNDKHQ